MAPDGASTTGHEDLAVVATIRLWVVVLVVAAAAAAVVVVVVDVVEG